MMPRFANPPGPATRRPLRRGSAVFVVIALLACMTLMLVGNTRTLHHLDRELKRLDEQQRQKYGQSARD